LTLFEVKLELNLSSFYVVAEATLQQLF